MKSRSVETITSNEGHVRLKIYDGDLPLSEAGRELIRLAQAQANHAESRLQAEVERRCAAESRLIELLSDRDDATQPNGGMTNG